MDLELLFLGTFKRGEFDWTEEAKRRSETGKIIKVFDGDVTTYLYELPSWYDEKNQEHKDELLNSLSWGFAEHEEEMELFTGLEVFNDEVYAYLDYV